LSGSNRITKVIVGIALAMRYLHSQEIIHCDLKPANILLDWNWNVRIADFDQSSVSNKTEIPSLSYADPFLQTVSLDFRYLAPECYDRCHLPESDVFSFGMILYELLTGQPGFPKELTQNKIAFRVILDDERPQIPEFVVPSARKLITDCWGKEPSDRLSFEEIVDRLKNIKFKVMPNVNSQKLRAFVKEIEELEKRNTSDTQ
jgi:serine/threonine protein kinase